MVHPCHQPPRVPTPTACPRPLQRQTGTYGGTEQEAKASQVSVRRNARRTSLSTGRTAAASWRRARRARRREEGTPPLETRSTGFSLTGASALFIRPAYP
ncbi:hypothetical protein K456DRAFT_1182514 [Colletotrichum gloeosporioides 23]|nr:hypothetical protein K456DRAFT_1182514 [Colletotrichum gloeosporioides 23]